MGVKEKKFFFRPEVTFGVDARWLLNRFENGKKIARDRSSGVVCHHLGYDTAPGGFVRGAQRWGKIFARAFLRANSILRRANFFGMSKIDVKPYSLPITTLISHLFPKFRE